MRSFFLLLCCAYLDPSERLERSKRCFSIAAPWIYLAASPWAVLSLGEKSARDCSHLDLSGLFSLVAGVLLVLGSLSLHPLFLGGILLWSWIPHKQALPTPRVYLFGVFVFERSEALLFFGSFMVFHVLIRAFKLSSISQILLDDDEQNQAV